MSERDERAGLSDAERESLIEAIQDGAQDEWVERILSDRLSAAMDWHPPHGSDTDCGPCLADYDRGFRDGEAAARAHLGDVLAGLRGEVAEAIHDSDCGCEVWRSDDEEDQTYKAHADAVLAVLREAMGVRDE